MSKFIFSSVSLHPKSEKDVRWTLVRSIKTVESKKSHQSINIKKNWINKILEKKV